MRDLDLGHQKCPKPTPPPKRMKSCRKRMGDKSVMGGTIESMRVFPRPRDKRREDTLTAVVVRDGDRGLEICPREKNEGFEIRK